MEKILLAIDAVHPDVGGLEFACYLAKLTKSRVSGVFMENLVADQKPVFRNMYEGSYLNWEIDKDSPEYISKMALIEKNINLFKEKCIKEEARHEVLRNQGVPAKELIAESRFADLIVLDTETSFKDRPEEGPTAFVNEVLHDAECPVVIAPESFEGIDEIVFAYNRQWFRPRYEVAEFFRQCC